MGFLQTIRFILFENDDGVMKIVFFLSYSRNDCFLEGIRQGSSFGFGCALN